MTEILGVLLLLGIGVVVWASQKNAAAPTAPAPTTPSGQPNWPTPASDYEVIFQAALKQAGGPQNLLYRAMFIQSHLETGGGTSTALRTYNNGFGFHAVGPGNAFWDGKTTYLTTEGENLRVYKSLADSIRDYIRLIQARYPAAVHAAENGSIPQYFAGLVAGGYATDPNYFSDLVARYKAIYGTNP